MDFESIRKYHRVSPMVTFKRENHVQKEYNDFLKNNPSHSESLREELFKDQQKWVITPNRFPYHFVDGTEHFLVWFRGDINWDLLDFLFRDEEVVMFENSVKNKSIKNIPHIHVFKKKLKD